MKRFLILAIALGASLRFALADTPAIVVDGAWSRPASDTAVAYATLRNRSSVADRLIGATSPVATHVGLHESSEAKMPPMSMNGMRMSDSMMSMKAVPAIVVPARGSVTLSPGGYHLMLDLRHPIRPGERIPLRLHFARAGWIAATASVRAI